MIVVTGGSGYIGSHVVDKLLESGQDVRVVDLLPPHRPEINWYKCDITSQENLLVAFRDAEVVYHLAAIADVNLASANPRLALEQIEIGTLNVLQAAAAAECERLILASSTWVYGRTEGVVTEDTPLPPPDNIYTKAKIGQEHLTIAWKTAYGLPYTILRYDIPYGPRMRTNMAIAEFVRRARNDIPITVFGDGSQGRCFIYVEDLAEGNVSAMAKGGENQTINLSTGSFVTIKEVTEAMRRLFPKLKVEYKPPRGVDFRGVEVDASKAERLLGWKSKTGFDQGLEKYVRWLGQAQHS